jgi:lysozyme
MKTNAAGIELIKRNEGCRLAAYLDSVGVWTIGYGDTGPHVVGDCTISQDEAEQRLVSRLEREFEPGVLRAIGDAQTTANQFAAMVSLAYNIGVGAFAGSTVARQHQAGNHAAAAEAFGLWNKAGGKVLAGLTRRRAEEAKLYAAVNS